MTRGNFPPQTEDIEELARFFDQVDTAELAGLEEVAGPPQRDLVSVRLRVPRQDLELLRRAAAHEGMTGATLMRWVLHRFARSLASRDK